MRTITKNVFQQKKKTRPEYFREITFLREADGIITESDIKTEY